MISKLSKLITKKLLKRNIISEDDEELYDYGLFIMISYVAFFIIAMLFGIALSIPFSSLLFYISFCLVRNFAGGVHANTEIKCDIITTASILACEILIKFLIDFNLVIFAFFLLIVDSICLCIIKPVATSQKEINQQEEFHFHKKVVMLSVFALIISVASMMLNVYNITIALSVGLSLANTLLITSKLQQFYRSIFIK